MRRGTTSHNLEAYLKLNQRKLADQYVVLISEKLVAKGTDIEAMLRRVKQRYPGQTPFVAKIPSPTTLILWL